MNSPWIPYAYQYGISAVVFAAGILLAVRKGTLILSYRHDRWTLLQLAGGFIALMVLHAGMILAAGV